MATGFFRMEDSVLEKKLRLVDDLEQEFYGETAAFVQEVKTKMKTQPKDVASQCFKVALLFLSQVFPNLDNFASASVKSGTEASRIDDKLKEVDEKLKELEGKIDEQHNLLEGFKTNNTDKLIGLSDDFGDHKSKQDTVQYEFDEKLQEIKDNQEQSKNNIAKESKTTATPASTNQSSGASAAAATTSSRSPLSLSQRKSFQIGGVGWINDAKLLSDSLFLVADGGKKCVRLLSAEGQELDTIQFYYQPCCLAVLEGKAGNSWEVAVSLPGGKCIALLEVTQQKLSKKSTIPTQREYTCLTAVDQTTLAAGYSWFDGGPEGVDLIDITGKVLHNICSDVWSRCMFATQDQHLLVFDSDTFYKFDLRQRAKVRKCTVPQIEYSISMASLQNDSYVVADWYSRVLHLVSGDGQARRELWNHPNGADEEDHLTSVTVMGDVCICCSIGGSVFVFSIQGQ